MVKQTTKLTGKLKTAVDKEINKKLKQKVEPKAYDQNGLINISNAGQSALITQMAQGTGVTNRIGNKVKVRHIEFNFQYNGAVNTVNPPFNNIRQIILQDNNDDGSLFATTDLLLTNNNISQLNYNNFAISKRFRILSDKNISLDKYVTPANFYTDKSQKLFRIRISGKKMGPVCYTGSSGTANVAKGQVWVFWISDSTVDLPAITYYSRVVFEDM